MPIWQKLQQHQQSLSKRNLSQLFAENPHRTRQLSIEDLGWLFDYSKNLLTPETIQLLVQLAKDCRLEEQINAMFSGEKINTTEQRAVLHVALRNQSKKTMSSNDDTVLQKVQTTLVRMRLLTEQLRAQKWLGVNKKPIRNIVNLGIGGSNLGPKLVVEALEHCVDDDLSFYFVSSLDATALQPLFNKIDPTETLFIVVSKSFGTEETLQNALAAKAWLQNHSSAGANFDQHFLAITANQAAATEWGIKHIFPFWDWVGGRFSLCSAVGLSVAIAIGFEKFLEILAGFHQVDEHFRQTAFDKNIPVLLGLIGVWYTNFWQAETQAVLAYQHGLRSLVPYLQQLDMESCGKSVDKTGQRISYNSGPIVFGGTGTDGQHAFFQLLHQGTRLVPCDFIGFTQPIYKIEDHHQRLMSHFIAQQQALAFGKTEQQLKQEGVEPKLCPFRMFEGNKPSSCLLTSKLTPRTLGQLIAFYEHKIFTEGVIWNINVFDQWGVELGKQLAKEMYHLLQQPHNSKIDTSSAAQIRFYAQNLKN